MNAFFENRTEAGMALADLAGKYAGANTVVFGLSKGGVLVAAELAHWLDARVDLFPVRTLELPCDESTTVGAVGPAGFCVLDDAIVDLLDIENDAIGTLRCEADAAIEEDNQSLRGGRPLPNVRDQTVILVDDVIANSLNVRAAILYLQQQQPRIVVVAAPVIVKPARHDLHAIGYESVAVDEPQNAPDLGQIYVNPMAPSNAEVRRVLGVRGPTDEVLAGLPTDDA